MYSTVPEEGGPQALLFHRSRGGTNCPAVAMLPTDTRCAARASSELRVLFPPTRFHCPDPEETNSQTSLASPIVAVVADGPMVSEPARFRMTEFDPADHFTANVCPDTLAEGMVTVTVADVESIRYRNPGAAVKSALLLE